MKKRRLIHPRKKQKIFERDNFKCVNCGCTGDFNALEVDHIIPVKDGGLNDDSNLQTLCYKCNMKKHYKKNVINKYFLDLSPIERLDLIKKRLIEYKHLKYSEFKVIFTQDELFKRLRVNLLYLEDLFREISGNKRVIQSYAHKYEERDACFYILKEITGFTYQALSKLLSKHGIDVSIPTLARVCKTFGDSGAKIGTKVEESIDKVTEVVENNEL